MRKLTLIILGVFCSMGYHAQVEVPISQGGVVNICDGAFLDSGSAASDYQPNENYTITICPETEGDVVYVDFLNANIICPNNNNCDYLQVFDGDNTGAGSMGTVNGPITFTASPLNPTGCLTFQFVSNGSGEGSGWAATVTCDTPCDRPNAEATTDPGGDMPILVCVGEEITFDGTSSSAADGFTIDSWEWDFRDGTTDTSGPVVTHTYENPGEYIVQLYLVDDNGCASTNRTDIQIWVSTLPNWELTLDTDMCVGEEACQELDASVLGVEWNAIPTIDLGSGVLVPDIVGECFESTVEFNSFGPGQTLTSIDDLESIYMNFEHSFMGDLLIQIICPDGTTVNLHEQGGGGTFLGVPVDDESLTPGVGWDYWWADDAPNGTWVDEAGAYTTLPSDTYSSIGNLSDLVGCPLNGIWSLSLCDLWGADNGYVFEWTVNFNPDIYPDLTSFTPIYGQGADSTWWDGPFISSTSADGNTICADPNAEGNYDYTVTVINNFGCEFDSTITVNCWEAGLADAGPDISFCSDQTELEGGLQGEPATSCSNEGGNYTYCYGESENTVFTYCPDNPGDGVSFMDITFNSGTTEGFFDAITIYDGDDTSAPILAGPIDGNLAGLSFVATNPSGCITMLLTTDGSVSCQSGSQTEWDYDVGCNQGGTSYDFQWTPADGLSDPDIPNPNVLELNGETTYTLTAFPTGHPLCVSSDDVVVTTAFSFDVSSSDPSCNGNDGQITVEIDGSSGTPPWDINFYEGGVLSETLETNGGTTQFSDLSPGSFSISVGGGNCVYEIDIEIEGAEPIFVEISADTTICINGTAILSAWSEFDDDNSWDYVWDNGLGTASSVNASPDETTTYSMYGIDDFGCETPALEIIVDFYDSLSVFSDSDLLICTGGVASLGVNSSSGGYGDYSYNWTTLGQSIGSGEDYDYYPSQTGIYCVTISDECETPTAQDCMEVVIETPIDVQIDSDTTNGCVPTEITFSNPNDASLFINATWETGDGGVVSTLDDFSYLYQNAGVYDVSLTLVSPIGCVYSGTYSNYISIYNNPVAGWTANPQLTRIPDTEINFYDGSYGDILEYLWVFDTTQTLGYSYLQNPVFEFPYSYGGEYPVSLSVTDIHGCTDRIVRYIIIDDNLNIYVPNSFTPNADGINEVFFVEGTDIDPDRFDLKVFNRWGDIVFETQDMDDVWTGGVQNGTHYVPDGSYVWKLIVYSKTTAERHEMVGHVTLIR